MFALLATSQLTRCQKLCQMCAYSSTLMAWPECISAPHPFAVISHRKSQKPHAMPTGFQPLRFKLKTRPAAFPHHVFIQLSFTLERPFLQSSGETGISTPSRTVYLQCHLLCKPGWAILALKRYYTFFLLDNKPYRIN